MEETLGSGFVRLRVSEAERRQAKHDIRCVEDAVIELLRNSRDAGATRIFVASSKEGDLRTVTIVDDGVGIPPDMHARVFDARVTSKLDTIHMDRWGVHGRGMALFSIMQNAQSAKVVASDVGMGTSIQVVFDTRAITERAEQSKWPDVRKKDNAYEVRGPKNIIRACVEFAIETRDECKVYVGSASEILSTMRKRIRPSHGTWMGDEDGFGRMPLVERPGHACDAHEMCAVASSLGLEMSERTAHRIVREQIKPLVNAYTAVTGSTGNTSSRIVWHDRSRRLMLTETDRREFLDEVSRAFQTLADRYYVRMEGEPKLRVDGTTLHVSLSYADDE